jgi:ABC-2 type transport system ATP-binding protein
MGQNFAIKTSKLSKHYGDLIAVDELDLEVKKGEVFGFLGPNGAGKTTTIRMLLNLIFPTSGESLVLGKNPVGESYQVMSDIGYIAGEVAIPDRYTVKRYLDFLEDLHGEKSESRASLIDRFELDESRKITNLSKGNRQKVSIIQAFMNSPKLLILDEPTSGLDPLLQIEFYKLIKENKDRGVTVFVSSHVLSEVQRICDRVGIIKNGKLIKIEDIVEITNRSIHNVKISSDKKTLERLKIPGSPELHYENGHVSFIYSGNINELIKELSFFEIEGLNISEPDLEQLFLHYYED